MKRKFFALLTALCLLVCISLPAGATSPIDSSPANFVFEQISAIASTIPNCPWNESTTISTTTTLFNLDGIPNGYIFNLLTDDAESGFIQIHDIDGSYSIYCYAFDGHSEVDSMANYWGYDLSDTEIYFLGSFKYAIATDSGYLNLASNAPIDIGDETVQTNAIAYAEQVSVDPLIIDDAEPSMESGIMPLGSDDDFYWPITDDFKNLSISYNGKTHNGMHDHCTPTAATGIFRYLTHLGKTSCTSGESTNKTFEKLYISLNTNNIIFSSFVSVGTARNQIDVGLRSYASGNNCSFDIERSSFNTLSSMKDHLDRGRLLLISVDDFGDPAVDHSIVATGYSSNSLYIQNGWSRNRIMYSYSSLDIAQYVYISPLPW